MILMRIHVVEDFESANNDWCHHPGAKVKIQGKDIQETSFFNVEKRN